MSESQLQALFGLNGKVALVTGASSGLSQYCARALARAGASVGLVARRADRLVTLAEELENLLGVRALAAPADVTDRNGITRAFDAVQEGLGLVDVVVHGAGAARVARAESHTREDWDAILALNLTGSFEVSQEAARRMIADGRPGSIILLSSVIAQGANPVHRTTAYAASKGGTNNLVRQLAIEWARHGIRVNAIAPGYFPTEMTIDPRVGDVAEWQQERIRQFTPMARLGRPEELQTAVLYLAAPASSYVTGSVVAVDGGWTAW